MTPPIAYDHWELGISKLGVTSTHVHILVFSDRMKLPVLLFDE